MRKWLRSVSVVVLVGASLCSPSTLQAQARWPRGAVVALQGTPHLWVADDAGVLHWLGDTRAAADHFIDWNNKTTATADTIRSSSRGDPWLSAGLLKDGDPIYIVKWESGSAQPMLLHIQSIQDVDLFGINVGNYGQMVIDRGPWESRFGMSAAALRRDELSSAVAAAAPQPAPIASQAPSVPVQPALQPAVVVTPVPAALVAPVSAAYRDFIETVRLTANGTSSTHFFYTNLNAGDQFSVSFTEANNGDIHLYVLAPDNSVLFDAGKPRGPYQSPTLTAIITGTYRIYFDNGFSVVSGKTVTYTVRYPQH